MKRGLLKQVFLLTPLWVASLVLAGDLPPRKSNVIVISGGGDEKADKSRYVNNVRDAVPAFRAALPGSDLTLIAADGVGEAKKWSQLASDLSIPSEKLRPASKEVVQGQIIESSKGLVAGDSLTLYITDHGSSPDNDSETRKIASSLTGQELASKYPGFASLTPEEQNKIRYAIYDRIFKEQRVKHRNANPLSAGVVLWGSSLTGVELLEMLKRVPPGVKVKLVGVQCYSGMLNEVASRLPNACASASTDYRTVNYSSGEKSYFSDGFTDGLASAGRAATLDGAHRAGVAVDFLNGGRAQISSAYFAERAVLRAGVPESVADARIKAGMDRSLAVRALELFTLIEDGTLEGASEEALQALLSPPTRVASVPTGECTTSAGDSPFAMITKINGKLKQLMSGTLDPDQGDELQLATDEALQGLKKLWPDLKLVVGNYRTKRAAIVDEWQRLVAAGQADAEVTEEGKTSTQRAIFTQRFEKLRKEFELRILNTGVVPFYRDLKDAVVLQKFEQLATPEEKAKYKSLRTCETEPL